MFKKTTEQKKFCNAIADCKNFIKNNNNTLVYSPYCHYYEYGEPKYKKHGAISVAQQDEKAIPKFSLYIRKEIINLTFMHCVTRFRIYIEYGDQELKYGVMKRDYGYHKVARLYNMCFRKYYSK